MKNKVPQHGRQWNSIRFLFFFVYFSPVVVFWWEFKEFRMTRNPTLFCPTAGKKHFSLSRVVKIYYYSKILLKMMMNQLRTSFVVVEILLSLRFVRENIFVKYILSRWQQSQPPTVRVGRTFWTENIRKKFNEGMKSGMKRKRDVVEPCRLFL